MPGFAFRCSKLLHMYTYVLLIVDIAMIFLKTPAISPNYLATYLAFMEIRII